MAYMRGCIVFCSNDPKVLAECGLVIKSGIVEKHYTPKDPEETVLVEPMQKVGIADYSALTRNALLTGFGHTLPVGLDADFLRKVSDEVSQGQQPVISSQLNVEEIRSIYYALGVKKTAENLKMPPITREKVDITRQVACWLTTPLPQILRLGKGGGGET
ncbi:MAG: hypothetical protein Q4G02_01015 [bacterium]|nr:hypothetical protein [bacterium]